MIYAEFRELFSRILKKNTYILTTLNYYKNLFQENLYEFLTYIFTILWSWIFLDEYIQAIFYKKSVYLFLMFTCSLISEFASLLSYQMLSSYIYILGIIVNLVITILLFLIFTILAATVTLNERKLLSLVQRRVGPDHIGYKGRLQYIADALKLLLKHIFVVNNNTANRLLFLIIPAALLIVGYLGWVNILWSWNLSLVEVENNLLLMNILSGVFTYLVVLVGYVGNNKYSIYSSNRVLLVTVNLEIYLSFFILFMLLYGDNFSFEYIVMKQAQTAWAFWCFIAISPFLLIVFLLETGRIPFDYMEAESELIAGVTIEYSGFYFALFYLNEYFHLISFSAVYTICLFGGWT
jgi:NADH-quinone oxidoreductase subunit H